MEESMQGLERLGNKAILPPTREVPPEVKPQKPAPEKPVPADQDKELMDEQAENEPKPEEQQTDQPKPEEKPLKPGEKAKVSPWKLVDHYKVTNTTLQKEIAELRAQQGKPPKELQEKWESIQKRNDELEQHIRFVDYQKSSEFVEKYSKPYEEAWVRAISGLKGLRLQFRNEETGEVAARDITPQDIAALANMDPATARLEIRQRFPEDAAEVKGYIERIRDLAHEQNKALEEHKTKGGEWLKQQQEQYQAKVKEFTEKNTKLWEQYNKEATEKFEFLRPVEGQQERNEKLEKATKFVDEALNGRINDPNLTEDQRAAILKRHAALRNRAIAYSVLMHENKSLKAKIAEHEKALKAYQESEPTGGGGKGKEVNGEGGDMMEQVLQGMNKYARG